MIEDILLEYRRYKVLAEKAIEQVPDDEGLNQILSPDNNSIAIIVRHISGNLISRFTDFLTSDGEKPWRNRDAEFEFVSYTRTALTELWQKGWAVLERELAQLTEADLAKQVFIRQQPLTVQAALLRSLAHVSYHSGQIVLLARILMADQWQSLSIPRGKSQEYNQRPAKERHPSAVSERQTQAEQT